VAQPVQLVGRDALSALGEELVETELAGDDGAARA
jgi:hypothetical protein